MTIINKEKLFWSKVIRLGPEECWNWKAGCFDTGYGAFRFNGKQAKASRIAWIFTNGDIPKNLYVLHHCDNKKCCNPSHLFLGTNGDNIRDYISKGHTLSGRIKKLNKADRLRVIELCASKKISQGDIAKMFKVCRGTISSVYNKTI